MTFLKASALTLFQIAIISGVMSAAAWLTHKPFHDSGFTVALATTALMSINTLRMEKP